MIKNTGHRKLGKTPSHKRAMFRNMSTSIILHEQIETTVAKAKELRREVDGLITLAKAGNEKRVSETLKDKVAFKKLFEVLAERYAKRNGGFTRTYKLGVRKGDNAETALIKLVE